MRNKSFFVGICLFVTVVCSAKSSEAQSTGTNIDLFQVIMGCTKTVVYPIPYTELWSCPGNISGSVIRSLTGIRGYLLCTPNSPASLMGQGRWDCQALRDPNQNPRAGECAGPAFDIPVSGTGSTGMSAATKATTVAIREAKKRCAPARKTVATDQGAQGSYTRRAASASRGVYNYSGTSTFCCMQR